MSTAFLCMAAVGCSQKQESKSESSEPSSTPASSEVSSVASSEESPSSISVSISSEESSSEESSIESSSSEEIISSSSEEEISSSETIPPTPKIPEANVFVLSGQSNMQGNSICSEANLRQAFEDLGFDDYDEVAEGMDSVLTSVYCAGYGELDHTKLEQNSRLQSYTNPDNQFAGKFVPTVPGFGDFNGTSGTKMGPEFGAAYYLREYVKIHRLSG